MIRVATREAITKIRELMESEPSFYHKDWRLERGIDSADGLAFVWDDNGQVIGFACAHDLGFRAYLSTLIVTRSARDKGIGKRLVQHIEDELKSRGCKVLISDV